MCLVTFSIQPGTRHPLVVAANRDESRSRPSAPVSIWPPSETDFERAAASVVVAGGRDLQAGGTWLGVASNGRFAALTNFPPSDNAEPAPLADRMSRGTLCKDFLEGAMLAVEYAATVAERFHQFDGFNLVVHDGTGDGVIVYCTNRCGDDGKGYTRVSAAAVLACATLCSVVFVLRVCSSRIESDCPRTCDRDCDCRFAGSRARGLWHGKRGTSPRA
jgi:uncharacterized protein with NRDE domain